MENNRSEQRRQWWKRNEGKYEKKPSMLRRKDDHDYYGRCIYMITIKVANCQQLLGSLENSDETHCTPWISPSLLGNRVLHYWNEISYHHPHVKLLKCQLMPDHFHGILFVTEKSTTHLGTIINSFKKACSFAAQELSISPLWEKGYNDIILYRKGQLDRMIHYVEDNPRRLWIKRNNPEFFKIRKNVSLA